MASLKAQLRELDVQRQAIEAEVEERSARLNAPGMPGLKGSLVDKEVSAVDVAMAPVVSMAECCRRAGPPDEAPPRLSAAPPQSCPVPSPSCTDLECARPC